MLRRLALGGALLLLAGAAYLTPMALGWYGRVLGAGEPTARALPPAVLAERAGRQRSSAAALGASPSRQILFGDLHVHTTFSSDAFVFSLPFNGGEGAHPLADACDFARFCSGLDFWSITDHAEALTPRKWRETRQTIRQCNEISGGPADPDVVAFLGWEWTQIGRTPETHWGHKNVVLRETDEGHVPTRPIASRGFTATMMKQIPLALRLGPALLDFSHRQRYFDFDRFVREMAETPPCADGVDVRALPEDCAESTVTPGELFEKLDQWGFEALVIPHGTTWGIYTPAESSWDKQLAAAQHDPERQTLIEVYSGHGNSEEYRSWRPLARDEAGGLVCPEPRGDYLPSCWQAGEIIRGRCLDEGEEAGECEARAAQARAHFAAAGQRGMQSIPGETALDWLDAGQCRDCFQPAYNYRPAGSAQYIAALTNFSEPEGPRRFRFGFIASSDNHSARPGTGYKEVARRAMTDQSGPSDAGWYGIIRPPAEPSSRSVPSDPLDADLAGLVSSDYERQGSFWLTGGLVAVHATERSRDGVWEALERRETYGTSGERILLWFDLMNPPNTAGKAPMGSQVTMRRTPRFRVRAAGAFEQQPGCPESSRGALAPERLERLCRGECYHPSDRRKRITHIDVVRIRPQASPGEPVDELIEDPWRRFECAPDPAGCTVEFTDPEFTEAARDVVYYARAVQAPNPAINARNLRCTVDAEGRCVEVDPCWGDFRTPASDECLGETAGRAWSSPIYVDFAPEAKRAVPPWEFRDAD